MGVNRKKQTLPTLGFLLIATISCIIYWPGLHGPFVFDDLTNIVLAPALRISELSFDSLRHAAFWQESSSLGRPIAMLSFALNYYFTQFDTFYFKLTNLIIHLVNGALLYWLGLRILKNLQAHASARVFTLSQCQWFSLAVTALWLVHPLNLTSVLYVVQRMTSLATLFILLGLAGYILGREQIVAGKSRGFLVIIASLLGFGVLATLTKENGVLLPLFMLVVEVWIFTFAAPGGLKRILRWYWSVLIGIPIIAALVILAVKPDLLIGQFNYQYRDFTLGERLLTETRAIWFYLRLILIPDIRQMGIYHDDFQVSNDLFTPSITPFAVVGLLVLTITALFAYHRARILSFAVAWFLAGHTLESTFIPLELVHEHRNYLPQYGILFALVYYLTYPHQWLQKSLRLRQSLLVLYLALLCSVTYARALDWTDEWTMYNRDVINHPNSASANTILGILLHDNKQYASAEYHFTRAAQVSPTDAKTILRLAQHVYTETRTIPNELLTELDRRLRLYSYSGITLWTFEPLLNNTLKDPVLNLRLIHMYEKLIGRKDIILASGWYQSAYRTLAFTYRERKEYKTALLYFDKAIELKPEPGYYLSKGEIYIKLGRPEDASDMIRALEKMGPEMNQDEQLRKENLAAAIKSALQKRKSPNQVNN